MSLAADTARTASNWNCALTLNWFILMLERSHERIAPSVALDMINEHLSSLERTRKQMLEDERVKREMNEGQLAEVLT